jgi:hypothetical protein
MKNKVVHLILADRQIAKSFQMPYIIPEKDGMAERFPAMRAGRKARKPEDHLSFKWS